MKFFENQQLKVIQRSQEYITEYQTSKLHISPSSSSSSASSSSSSTEDITTPGLSKHSIEENRVDLSSISSEIPDLSQIKIDEHQKVGE